MSFCSNTTAYFVQFGKVKRLRIARNKKVILQKLALNFNFVLRHSNFPALHASILLPVYYS
uniref:MKI67 FHA domain-interacting nucleolar phosphoprotein n=1 Tax=Rhizophora mucronata TaxID=61149 RepID=A0A2P2LPA1_RHIMU